MNLSQAQVTRFYETLALLIANKEGVDIKVTVTPGKEGQNGKQDGKAYNSIPQRKQVRVP